MVLPAIGRWGGCDLLRVRFHSDLVQALPQSAYSTFRYTSDSRQEMPDPTLTPNEGYSPALANGVSSSVEFSRNSKEVRQVRYQHPAQPAQSIVA